MTVNEAVTQLEADGLTVFRGAVRSPLLDRTCAFGAEVVRDALERGTGHALRDAGERTALWLVAPVAIESVPVPEVLAIPEVLDVLDAVFGGSGMWINGRPPAPFKLVLVGLHIAMPGLAAKPPHRDLEHYYGGRYGVTPPPIVFVHLPLCEFREENGATRYIPGTHCSFKRPPTEVIGPEYTVCMSPGDVMVRDPRVWHAVGANSTDTPRAMISLGYAASWFGHEQRAVSAEFHARLDPRLRGAVARR